MRVMTKTLGALVLMTGLALGAVSSVSAQQGRGGAPEAASVPLKVTVAVSRYEGEKKTASLPFVLWVNTGGSASVQMGSDVPVPQTVTKDNVTSMSYTYRSLGTNISCQAEALADGLYRVTLSVQDTQIFRMSGVKPAAPGDAVYQNFRSTNSPMLRDGQTVQFAVATDKTSGEVIKLDVTLNVVK